MTGREHLEAEERYKAWRNELTAQDDSALAMKYIKNWGYRVVGPVTDKWTNRAGEDFARISFDMESDFEDWLFNYWKRTVLNQE